MSGKLFITDLDGTLFRSDHTFSDVDLEMLNRLGEMNVTRVIATGRSLFSFQRSVKQQLPIDYLIFSTGSGIARYPEARSNILTKTSLSADETNTAATVFEHLGVDYMIQRPVPDNHMFQYRYHGNGNKDFVTRLKFYENHCEPLGTIPNGFGPSSQLLAIVPPEKGIPLLKHVRGSLPGLNVIKTTSPFDGNTLWIEVFPKSVSKSQAAEWLCGQLNITRGESVAIGNDFNDEDLLKWAGESYVVENAPPEMKRQFTTVASNNHCGVADAVRNSFGFQ